MPVFPNRAAKQTNQLIYKVHSGEKVKKITKKMAYFGILWHDYNNTVYVFDLKNSRIQEIGGWWLVLQDKLTQVRRSSKGLEIWI